MPINSENTLIFILQNKTVFFRLMDMVQQDGLNAAMEFRISDYETLLHREFRKLEEAERRRLFEALNTENLDRNGLLNYLDRRSGRFRLQDFILEMLRHLDSKRLRELSSAELNQLMKQLEECYRQVSNPRVMWIAGDSAFKELVDSVYNNLQNVASRLKSNIRALKGQAERLASVVDQREYTDLDRTDQVRLALREILRIHDRHVTPTLQFLDERLDIRRSNTELHGGSAPMALVKKIIDRFSERNLTDHVTLLQRIQIHMLAMGREVADIAKGLDTYVKYAEAERRRYNRTEQLYNALRDAVQERQTGQLRDVMLKPVHPIFHSVRPLGGLKNFCRTQTSNINWPSNQGSKALDEILRVRLAADKKKDRTSSSARGQALTERELSDRRLIERIVLAMSNFNYKRPYEDVYLSVHEHLCASLEGYSLAHIVDALPFLTGIGSVELSYPPMARELEYRDLRLRYRQRSYNVIAISALAEASS